MERADAKYAKLEEDRKAFMASREVKTSEQVKRQQERAAKQAAGKIKVGIADGMAYSTLAEFHPDFEFEETEDWVVDELLPAHGITLMAGATKAGKTTAIWCLIKALLSGDKFLDRDTEMTKRIAFLTEETRRSAVAEAKAVGLGWDILSAGGFCLFYRNDEENRGARADEVFTSMEYAHEDNPFGLVIVDTMNEWMAVEDITSYNQTGDMFRRVKAFVNDYGVPVLILHHQSKSHKTNQRDKSFGSVMINGAADVIWQLNEVDPNNEDDSRRQIYCEGRAYAGMDKSKFTVNYERVRSEDGLFWEIKAIDEIEKPAQSDLDSIADWFLEHEAPHTKQQIIAAGVVTQGMFRYRIPELVASGVLVRRGKSTATTYRHIDHIDKPVSFNHDDLV